MAFVPLSLQTIFDGGYAVLDARLYAFEAGTTTPRPLFRTSALDATQQHQTPVPADGNGRFPPMFTGVGDYDVRITSSDGATLASWDGLPGDPRPTTGGTTIDPLRQIPTGALVAIHSTGRRAGWVRANGATIGSAASAGVERAADDCYALFLLLWDDPHQIVAGGRGQTAQDDWDAGKTITVPSYQGRFVLGAANMGNANEATGRLDGGALPTDGAVLGAVGGEAAHKLSVSELAAHKHDVGINIKPNGEHTHSGSIGDAGQHNHAVYYGVNTLYGAGTNGAVGNVGNSQAGSSVGYTELAPSHSHPLTINSVPGHGHEADVEAYNSGGDSKHNTLPPFVVSSIYLKL